MGQTLSLLITAEGNYRDSNGVQQFDGEIWACTVRAVPILGNTLADVGTIPNNFDVVSASNQDSGANWVASSNWTLEGGVNDLDPLTYLTTNVKTAFEGWISASTSHASCQLSTLKVYAIGTNGRAIAAPPFALGAPAVLTYTSAYPKGSGSGVLLPLQDAVAVSHRSAQIGRRGKGRMFCPGLPAGVIASPPGSNLSQASVDAFNARQKALLEALLIVDAGVSVFPAVITNTGSKSLPNLSQYAKIKSVRTGNVIDTQRRRRNQDTEVYTQVPVTNS